MFNKNSVSEKNQQQTGEDFDTIITVYLKPEDVLQ